MRENNEIREDPSLKQDVQRGVLNERTIMKQGKDRRQKMKMFQKRIEEGDWESIGFQRTYISELPKKFRCPRNLGKVINYFNYCLCPIQRYMATILKH